MAIAPTVPVMLSKVSQEGVLQFHRQCYSLLNQQWNIREQFRRIDLAYMRENDWTEEHQNAKIANRYGDATKIQNLKVPVVKPLITSAVNYQVSVFLTGMPIFGCVAAPEYEDEALQLETIIEDQSIRGRWVSHITRFIRDAYKYNIAALEVDWRREVTAIPKTDLSFSTEQAKPTEIIWQGNSLKALDMYNSFFDARVKPIDIPTKGEFAGYTELYTRIGLKAFIASLPTKIIANVVPAFESGLGSTVGGSSVGGIESYFIPSLNPDALIQKNPKATTDWLAWAGIAGQNNNNNIQYKNMYEVTTLYARILPSDFGIKVPFSSTPQVWKFIIVNHQVIIYAEQQTNAHGMLPILFCQIYEDGLSYQTKSMADDIIPIQDISSALANSWLASRRRAISDRALYDPSRVSADHINSANPSAKIPVRPSAYGKPVHEAVYHFPFRDDQAATALQEMQVLQSFGMQLTGQNQAKQGQFVKGNKTLHEYADVMSHANSNDQTIALLLEDQTFTPLKEILKINILQYQGGTSLFSRARKQEVKIDPVKLRTAVLNFKITDGLTPADKVISGDTLKVALQVIGSSPQLASGYNIAPMFSYLMKTQGAELTAFEKSPQQLSYEAAVQSWQQTVLQLAKQGVDPSKYPPQPKPQDYNYDPQQQGGNAPQPPAPEQVATRINNITNNIVNQEQ